MLKQTYFEGPKSIGEEHEVPEDVAVRWINNGIAEAVAIDVEFTEVPEVVYSDLTAKKLYKLCVELDLDVVAKESKEYYITKLNENNAVEVPAVDAE